MKELAVSSSAQSALLRLMVKVGLISTHQSEQFKESDACPLAFFSRQGLFSEAEALTQVAAKLKIPQVIFDKNQLAQSVHCLENPIVQPVPLGRWRSLRAVPLEFGEKSVVIAMANPLDHEAKGALEFTLGRAVHVRLASEEQILGVLSAKVNDSAVFDLDSLGSMTSEPTQSEATLDRNSFGGQEASIYQGEASSAPIVRLVNKIFSDAVQLGASDVHVTPEKDKLVVKARVDGVMQNILDVPAVAKRGVTSRIKLLCGMDIAEHRKPQDGRLRIKTAAGPRDLRISTVPAAHGENIVARILTSEVSHVSFEQLGMAADIEAQLKQALSSSSRVVLVTGPTGSGKTSTLYSSLLHLLDGTCNIITIEDPIEYRLAGLTQIQVNSKIGMNFAESLRAVLRQDPDVVMVGEIRDTETASVAMQVAQTGHLVLSTLHTNTAAAAVTRLRDLGVAPYLIASSLGAVLAQRLVRKLCVECACPAGEEVVGRLRALGVEANRARVASVGCPACGGSGFKGRVGVFSLLSIDEQVRECIRSGAHEPQIESCARSAGFRTLQEAGLDLVVNGIVSLDELERHLGIIEVARERAQLSASDRGEQGGLSRPRVLLVEDEENTRMVLSLLLQRERYEVLEAAHGLEGLDAVYDFAPELIITDLMMPQMNGHELVAKLKNDPRTRHIPILVLTAADTEEQELRLVSGGADDFVSKTTDSKIMLARVQRLLERALTSASPRG